MVVIVTHCGGPGLYGVGLYGPVGPAGPGPPGPEETGHKGPCKKGHNQSSD